MRPLEIKTTISIKINCFSSKIHFQCKWVSLMRPVHYVDHLWQVTLVVLLSGLHYVISGLCMIANLFVYKNLKPIILLKINIITRFKHALYVNQKYFKDVKRFELYTAIFYFLKLQYFQSFKLKGILAKERERNHKG